MSYLKNVSPGVSDEADGWLSTAASLGAACTLGLSLQISSGAFEPNALRGVTFALALCALAVLAARVGRWTAVAEHALTAVIGVALACQLYAWFRADPGEHLFPTHPWPYGPMYFALSLQALAAGFLLACSARTRRYLTPLLVLAYLPAGKWLIDVSPKPGMDVWWFQHDGAQALLHWQNPYSLTFANVYGNDVFYGAGMVKDGRLLFGFPYPPLSLYFATLGELFGDPRYAQLVCIALAALLMAYMQRGRLAVGAAALYLLTPRALLVLQMSWTEPILVFLLATVVFCARHYARAVPYVLGCLLAAKQYTIFIVPLIPLLTPLRGKELLTFLLRAAAVALALTLPLFLINPQAFIWSVIKLQFYQPFRNDALSYLPWWMARGHAQPPVWVAFAAAALATALALWRAPRTPAGFAAAIALVYGVFFAFNKQAFVNYYFFVVGAACLAACAGGRREADESEGHGPPSAASATSMSM